MRRLLLVVWLLAGCSQPPLTHPTPQLAVQTPVPQERQTPRELKVGEAPSPLAPSPSPTPAPAPSRAPAAPSPDQQKPPQAAPTPTPAPTPGRPVEVPLTGDADTPVEVPVNAPTSDATPVEVAAHGDVEVAAQFGTAAVLSTGQTHLLYMLVEARATEGTLEQWPVNLSLVIDTSQSMAGKKLDFAIQAVDVALGRIRPIDLASLVVFSQRAQLVLKVPGQRGNLTQLIRQTPVGEGTNLYAGIEAAVSEVNQNLGPDKLNHILLLTDGRTAEPERCLQDCLQAYRQGISFSSIGLGRDCNASLLRDLAERCSGRYYGLDAPSQLPAIFDQELKGVRDVQLRNNQLILTLAPGVRIRRAHRIQPQIRDLGEPVPAQNEVALPMGDLRRGETLSVLLELSVPDQRPGSHRVATARVQHDVPEGGNVAGSSHPLEVKFTHDRNQAFVQSAQVNAAVDAVTRYTHRGSR